MKVFAAVVAALFAGPVFAGEFTTFQTILFKTASYYVPGNNVCKQGSKLYHKTQDTVSVAHCNDNGTNCTTESKKLEQPIRDTHEICVEYAGTDQKECVKWRPLPMVQGPVIKVNIYDSYKSMSDNREPVATKHYTLPDCVGTRGI